MKKRSLKHIFRKLRGLRRRLNAITMPDYRRAALRGWTPRRHDAIEQIALSYRTRAAAQSPRLRRMHILGGPFIMRVTYEYEVL